MIKVAIAGYFDPIHEGHLDHIEAAKALGDWLVVIAGTEKQCDKKHGRHFHSWEGKVRVLKKLGADEVVPSVLDENGTCAPVLRLVRPDIYAKGDDFSASNVLPEAERVACIDIGCRVILGCGKRLNHSNRFWSREIGA